MCGDFSIGGWPCSSSDTPRAVESCPSIVFNYMPKQGKYIPDADVGLHVHLLRRLVA